MRLAEKWTYCSSCFGQHPELEAVDFEAYWDGPVLDDESGIKQAIDDLVLCEKCLRDGAKLVGMVYDEALKQENKELGQLVESQGNQIQIKDAAIEDLRGAVDHLTQAREKKAIANGN